MLDLQQHTAAIPFVPPDDSLLPSGNHSGRVPVPGADGGGAAAPLQRRYNELATLMHVTSACSLRI